MAIYIKVIGGKIQLWRRVTDLGESGPVAPTEILVNPDCPIRLIYEYIRDLYDCRDDLEVDLCDEGGNLIFMLDKDPWVNGLNYFQPFNTYLVVLFDKDEENRAANPMVYLPDYMRKSIGRMSEMLTKIKKQLNPSLSNKGSKTSKTRSSSYAK